MYRVTDDRYSYLDDFANMIGIFKPELNVDKGSLELGIVFLNRRFFEEFKNYIVFDGKTHRLILILEEKLNHFFSNLRSHKALVVSKFTMNQQNYFMQSQKMNGDLYCVSFFNEKQMMFQPDMVPALNFANASSGDEIKNYIINDLREKQISLELQNQALKHTAKAKANYLIDINNHFCIILDAIASSIYLLGDGTEKSLILRYIEELKTMTEFVSSMAKYNTETQEEKQKVVHLQQLSDGIYDYLKGLGNQYFIKYEYLVRANTDSPLIGDENRLKIILKSIGDCLLYVAEEQEITWRVQESQFSETENEIEFQLVYKGKLIDKLIATDGGKSKENKEQLLMSMKFSIIKQLASVIGGNLSLIKEGNDKNVCSLKWSFRRLNQDTTPETDQRFAFQKEKVILYVDDNLSSQDIMEKLIKKKGYHYKAAFSAQEAIGILETQKVDLVFMDIYMPQTDGYEAARIIREKHFSMEELPIVGMTAYTMNNSREACLKAGMNDYMEKPFEIDHLYKMIEKYLI